MLQREKLDELVCRYLRLDLPPADMSAWEKMVNRIIAPKHQINLAVVGKYIELQDAYKSIYEALTHAGAANDSGLHVIRVDAEDIEAEGAAKFLTGVDGILVPGGFGNRGIEGKIMAARFARENKIPYLGLCLGMQIAVIEFARNVCGLDGAHSTEFNERTGHPVISLLNEQQQVTDKGGSMRLGGSPCKLKEGSKARQAYGTELIQERHRHRYEFNSAYREQLESRGLVVSGVFPGRELVEIIEIADHPWFVACQFHPEFLSKPEKPHPLFHDFVKYSLEQHAANQT
jgi:CTP synthase